MDKIIGIIGLGSMGKRRLRLLQNNFSGITLVGVDTNQDRCKKVESEFGIECVCSLMEAYSKNHMDIAFVCTSPLTHAEIIRQCLNLNIHVFTEINLVPTLYDENIRLSKEKGLTLFLSSTFLYRKETSYIIEKANNYGGKMQYCYQVGQYLPNWHPWEKYQDYFVGKRQTNACREILAIDLPWLIKAFGKVLKISVVSSKLSNLDIDYNDSYIVTLNHENGTQGVFIIDVLASNPIRDFKVVGEDFQIEWKGNPDEFYEYNIIENTMKHIKTYEKIDKLEGYAEFIIEDEYLDEIKAFFIEMNNNEESRYSFEQDKYVLEIVEEIECLGRAK